jgi:hypothetical protein
MVGDGGSWVPGQGNYTIHLNPDIQDARAADTPPQLMNMLPNAGPLGGGTLVTIVGQGLADATSVFFGGVASVDFTVISDTEIQALSPAHTAGAVDVVVSNLAGDSELSSASVFTYAKVNTTTTVSSDPGSSTYGQDVTFSATVVPTEGFDYPNGTVTFWSGSTWLGTTSLTPGTGTAFFTTSLLGVGSHAITAVYEGDDFFNGSTSTVLTQTVNRANTITQLMSSANFVPAGTPILFTANVTDSVSWAQPTGLIEFWEVDPLTGMNLTLLGTSLVDVYGHGTLTVSSLTPGTHRIKAVYLGDNHFNASFSFLDLTII